MIHAFVQVIKLPFDDEQPIAKQRAKIGCSIIGRLCESVLV